MKGNRFTRYLWRQEFASEEEYESAKQYFRGLGYRVVTFSFAPGGGDMTVFFRQFIKNHIGDPAGREERGQGGGD